MSGHASSSTATPASRPARRRTAACSSIRGDASARCGISMKGVDIVVARLGRPHERVHGAGRAASSSAATRARRSATRSTRRASTCAAAVAGLGADCVEKEMRDEHVARAGELLERAGVDDVEPSRVPALRLGARALQLRRRQRRGVLMARPGWHPGLRESAPLRPQRDRTRSSAPRARASTTSAASAPSGRCRTSTTCCSSAPASRAIRSRATASAATRTSCSARATRRSRSS